MRTIIELINQHAVETPDKTALIILNNKGEEADKLTYGTLHRLIRQNARTLAKLAAPGARAVLSLSTSSEFAIAFLASMQAGITPVPTPSVQGRRYRDTVNGIVTDCGASVVICHDLTYEAVQALVAAAPDKNSLTAVCISRDISTDACQLAQGAPERGALAYLQYTSGSTSAPKGVAVSHQNLSQNLQMMTTAFDADASSNVVGWAPLHHDMGLVANLLHPLWRGATSILMSPETFASKPWLWPMAISHYGASISGGPNHAFDLLVRHADRILARAPDLSSWQVAFNSAEPVRHETITRFSRTFASIGFSAAAIYPCYGMAEATLLISGGQARAAPVVKSVSRAALSQGRITQPDDSGDTIKLVGCGSALAGGTICIVDPRDLRQLPDGEIGEIWVAGPNIPDGYWRQSNETKETIRATLADAPALTFLRTGDFGFVHRGELFFAGRQKDTIIIAGQLIFPQDIEYIAEHCHDGLRANSNALFAVQSSDTRETKLVLVQEVERCHRYRIAQSSCIATIRRSAQDQMNVHLDQVVLTLPGQLPKTSSGKTRRFLARVKFLQNRFATLPDN